MRFLDMMGGGGGGGGGDTTSIRAFSEGDLLNFAW